MKCTNCNTQIEKDETFFNAPDYGWWCDACLTHNETDDGVLRGVFDGFFEGIFSNYNTDWDLATINRSLRIAESMGVDVLNWRRAFEIKLKDRVNGKLDI